MSERIDTLGALHLAVERQHERKAVLLCKSDDGTWTPTPDWRFHRHVVRLALHLRERWGLGPGDRVALVGPLSPSFLVVDWATVAQGGTVVVLGADPTDAALDVAWSRFAPRTVFVAGEDARRRVQDRGGEVVTLDDQTSHDGPSFAQLLELGGTLDTAERAGAFRDRARAIAASSDAIVHVDRVSDGSPTYQVLTHAEVLARCERFRGKHEPRSGDVAYVRPDALSVDAHVALYGLLGGGVASTAIGTVGRELEEIDRLDPGMVVTRSDVLAARPKPFAIGGGRFKRWLDRTIGAASGGSR